MKLNKIILSRTDNIGDVVLALPMAGMIKKHYPDCKVIFLGRTYTKPIIDACENIDEFYKLMEGLRNNFSDYIKEYESIIYSKMHDVWNYFPFSE